MIDKSEQEHPRFRSLQQMTSVPARLPLISILLFVPHCIYVQQIKLTPYVRALTLPRLCHHDAENKVSSQVPTEYECTP